MNANIQLFKNDRFGEVRVTEINGEPIFCLSDVCNVLGLSNTSVVKSRLDDDLSLTYPIADSLGRMQETTFVTEAGFYEVVIRSDSPKAKPFRTWIASDVLPSIRKHGGYLTPAKTEELLMNPDLIIQMATSLKDERVKRAEAEKQIESQRPKVIFADSVEASKTSILIGELSKILKQNGIETGQNRLFEWMRQNGYLITRNGTDYNMPTQRSMELGLFEIKETAITHSDGHISITKTVKVNGKGQIYFINKFLNAA